MKEYGIQLYSLRDISKDDFEGMLKAVSEMGYKMVESAGFFGHSAEEVAAWQEKYGLTCAGTHSGTGELLPENIDATIAYHKTIGNKKFIIPGEDLSTLEKIDSSAFKGCTSLDKVIVPKECVYVKDGEYLRSFPATCKVIISGDIAEIIKEDNATPPASNTSAY